MSNPISNFIKVVSGKETFENIVNILIDEERAETTYPSYSREMYPQEECKCLISTTSSNTNRKWSVSTN